MRRARPPSATNDQEPAEWQDVAVWPREDLPLLTVQVDHLRWISQLATAIMASPGLADMPPLDPRNCRFGHWLDAQGRQRYGHFPEFARLMHAHEAVHAAGHRIDQIVRQNRTATRGQLDTLRAQRDALLQSLGQLRGEVQDSRNASAAPR